MSAYDYDSKPSRDDFDSDDDTFERICFPSTSTNRKNGAMQPTTTTDSSFVGLPVPADARSMVGGETEDDSPELTENQIKLMGLAKILKDLSRTAEQLAIADTASANIRDKNVVANVIDLCGTYLRTHKKPIFFDKKVYEIIIQIYNLSMEVYNEEYQISSSASGVKGKIFSFYDDQKMVALTPKFPQGVIDFFKAPGKNHYLFVRMLSNPYFEARMLLGKAKGTPGRPIRHWLSVTAIKNGVPFELLPVCGFRDSVGFLFSQDTSVGITTEGNIAWGKRNLNSRTYIGLDTSGNITVTHDPKYIEKNPIGEKLEEIRKRKSGEWPDLQTKELKAFLYERRSFSDEDMKTEIRKLAPKISDADLAEIISLRSELGDPASFKRKDPAKARRYRIQEVLPYNEVLIHPTIENMLGIVIIGSEAESCAISIQNYIKDNGGPHFPIFLYTLGNLTPLEK